MSKFYESPFNTRYASPEMTELFSSDTKFKTWRALWIALAKGEQKCGLNITDAQIEELKKYKDDLNLEVAAAKEKEVRHDVMAHIYAYGVQCPTAKPIIHLGATSCYVGDNTDIIIMKKGLEIIRRKLANVIAVLSDFAMKYKDMPALAYTHLQPAQLTTVGKRATLWINDLLIDLDNLDFRISSLKMLGQKGTTGTQASFMELFEGDEEKINFLEKYIANEFGFDECVPVSGQTYSRKVDFDIMAVLSGIAQSAHKFSNDLRILQNFKEMEEPFEKSQIGSSAMAYKRNPMRSERIAALSRFVICDLLNPAITASAQWFERTLDDSANKRLAMTEGFLAVDSILNIYLNVADGLVVYPKVIHQRIMNELPFMATENILMNAVKKGGDRQELHEKIRVHSQAAAAVVKEEGKPNDLIDRICADKAFGLTKDEIEKTLDPINYIGRANKQTEQFIQNIVKNKLNIYAEFLGEKSNLIV